MRQIGGPVRRAGDPKLRAVELIVREYGRSGHIGPIGRFTVGAEVVREAEALRREGTKRAPLRQHGFPQLSW